MNGAVTLTAQRSRDLDDGQPGGFRAALVKLIRRNSTLLGFLISGLAVYWGWIGRNERDINAGEGLGYLLGIAGAALMLLLLLYSVRKRLRFMRRFGPQSIWFRYHMMFGVIGPVLILYHCNFQIGSLNSQVALYCTLLVAVSGVVGRYIYAQIHHGLYGSKASLQELSQRMSASSERLSTSVGFLDEIRWPLAALGDEVLKQPDSLLVSFLRPFRLAYQTRWIYLRLCRQTRRKLARHSATSPTVAKHRKGLEKATRVFLRQHLKKVRRVAQFSFYERLFSLWHVIHVPFFLMMVVSALVHVLAVHMY